MKCAFLTTQRIEEFVCDDELAIAPLEARGWHFDVVLRISSRDAAALCAERRVLEELAEQPLYARVDLVRSSDGAQWWLMELELIESSLYLRLDPQAPPRFADAIAAVAL